MPRSSSLSPYINDLRFALKKAMATVYSNNSVISCSSDKSEDLDLVINEELSCIERWLEDYKLSLNIVKTRTIDNWLRFPEQLGCLSMCKTLFKLMHWLIYI